LEAIFPYIYSTIDFMPAQPIGTDVAELYKALEIKSLFDRAGLNRRSATLFGIDVTLFGKK
jgi:hypothetical protein